jgi:hypothetical protein
MQRDPCTKLSQTKSTPRTLISICFDLTGPRGVRFSPASDVLPFCRLTYLTQTLNVRLDQNQ